MDKVQIRRNTINRLFNLQRAGMMDLKTFVTETINQIIDGVVAAQLHAEETNALVNPPIIKSPQDSTVEYVKGTNFVAERIEFDVAITTTEGDQSKGGLGIFIAAFGAGVRGETSYSSDIINRIRFSLFVMLPLQEVPDNLKSKRVPQKATHPYFNTKGL
jgi:hypothetical protein